MYNDEWPLLRVNGVSTNGAAAKLINLGRLGKKVRPGFFGKIKVGWRGYPKSPCHKNIEFAVTPLVLNPFVPFRSSQITITTTIIATTTSISISIYISISITITSTITITSFVPFRMPSISFWRTRYIAVGKGTLYLKYNIWCHVVLDYDI